MAGKVGNDRGKSDAASGFHVLAEGCAPAHTHAHPKLLSIHHESGFPLFNSLLFCLPMSGGSMQLERMIQPHVNPPVSTSPASEVKAKTFLLVINHLVCGLLQRLHKADEDRTLGRLLPIFLHTDSYSISCSNVLQEQAARSIKLNSAHEYQPPTQGFILHRHPHTSKNMYDESHYLQYPG